MQNRILPSSMFVLSAALAIACADDGSAPGDAGADAGTDTDTGFDPDDLPVLTFDAYHTYDEVIGYLEGVAAVAPELATYQVVGESVEGRALGCLVIDATGAEDPPTVFINGAHHGDERPSVEAAIGFVDRALHSLDDPDVAEGLGYFAVYVLPIVNPDGFVAGTRRNANDVDINRDYAGPTIPVEDAFIQPETQAMKALIDETGFVAAAAYHTTYFSVLWPWGCSADPTAAADAFTSIGAAVAEAMACDTYLQSYDDYPTEGEFLDYAYDATGTLAFTLELTNPKNPSADALPGIVDTAAAGTMELLRQVRAIDEGGVKLEPPAPRRGPGHVVQLGPDGGKLE